jgi:hypothetical protein
MIALFLAILVVREGIRGGRGARKDSRPRGWWRDRPMVAGGARYRSRLGCGRFPAAATRTSRLFVVICLCHPI